MMSSIDELDEKTKRLREAADYWVAMCAAISLTDGAGLQPFQVPSGWMGSSSPPPAQAYTQRELADEIEGNEPALHALIDAVIDRAPSLCRRPAMLPLARLASWTESDKWVRPLAEWPGEEQVEDDASSAA